MEEKPRDCICAGYPHIVGCPYWTPVQRHTMVTPCCQKCIIPLDYKPAQCSDGECNCHKKDDNLCVSETTPTKVVGVEEPQTESWRAALESLMFEEYNRCVHSNLPFRAHRISGAVSLLLSEARKELHGMYAKNCSRHEVEVRKEERQRVVRIAEGMKIAKLAKNTESHISVKRGAYNKALSDLSTRIQEDNQ